MTKEEKMMQRQGVNALRKSDPEKRLAELEAANAELEAQNEMLTECLLEISEIIYS